MSLDDVVFCGWCGSELELVPDGFGEAIPLCSEECWFAYEATRTVD